MFVRSNFKYVVSSETYERVINRVNAFEGLVPFLEHATHWYSDMQSNSNMAEVQRLLVSQFTADDLADMPDVEGFNEVARTCLSLLEGTPYQRFLEDYEEMYALIEESEWISRLEESMN